MQEHLRIAHEQIAHLQNRNRRLEAAVRELAWISSIDELTGLRNRRHFYRDLERAYAFAIRHGSQFSVVMLDIDDFKSYNDSFGHTAGDWALCKVAYLLSRHSRGCDVVVRFGGDEFAVLMPSADRVESRGIAEQVQISLGQFDWTSRPVTASLGVATLNSFTSHAPLLVEQADQCFTTRSAREGTG